ncbi:MAG: glycosyltransferase [Alphaproteobacteria bacterium]|nr:glycosyltransferase [Alphaproteobacteria bacterium]
MIRPKVSIITVVYNLIKNNRKMTFLRMLESVKSQNYGNIEHIIIDGNSNDGTKKFLKNLGLDFFSKNDDGIYDAMNNGIKKSTGKYIIFLNSDDYFFNENSIKTSVSHLLKSGADFSFGKTKYFDENGNIINGIFQENPDVKNLFLTMPYSHQSMMIKSDILKDYLFDKTYKIVADFDLTLKLFIDRKKYIYIPEYIVNFQIGGTSSNIENVHFETIKLYKNLFKKIGINLTNNEIFQIEYTKKIPHSIAKILCKKVGFKINQKLCYPAVKSKNISILKFLNFQIFKGENFMDFYIFNLIKILSIRWKNC